MPWLTDAQSGFVVEQSAHVRLLSNCDSAWSTFRASGFVIVFPNRRSSARSTSVSHVWITLSSFHPHQSCGFLLIVSMLTVHDSSIWVEGTTQRGVTRTPEPRAVGTRARGRVNAHETWLGASHLKIEDGRTDGRTGGRTDGRTDETRVGGDQSIKSISRLDWRL